MIRLSVLIAALVLANTARAQPSAAIISELEATQRRAAERTASIREREQAADKAMELRAKLIEATPPDDPRLAGWLMDSAAGELAKLGRDGSDTAVLFGIPLPAQKDAARQAAQRVASLLDQARVSLNERLPGVEGLPADDPKRAQVEQDRTVRIPFFAARASVILAACSSGPERIRHAKAAFDGVGKLSLSNAGPESIRRVCIGAALLYRAEPPDPADLQTAIDEFGWVLTGGRAGRAQAEATIATRAEAWFGLLAASGGLGRLDAMLEQFAPALAQAPFIGPDGHPDSLLVVLASDAISRAWAEQGFRNRDRALLDRAVAEQQALLRRQDLAVRPEALRPLAYQKLHLLGQSGSGVALPPAMDLARAIDAARDPARRADAIKLLQAVADAPNAGDFAADALWELAVLRTQGTPSAPDRLAAIEALTRLARDFQKSPRAAEAIAAALAHAQALSRQPGPEQAQGRTLYIESLRVATMSYPSIPGIDTWRYEYGRLLTDRDDAPLADLRTALNALREIPATASINPDSAKLFEVVQARILDDLWKRVVELRKTSAESVQKLCRDEVLPEARKAVDWSVPRRSPQVDRFRADLADALTECGDSGGQIIYSDLLGQKAEVPGGTSRLRLGQARSLMISGGSAAAFGMLRDLASALDTSPAGSPESTRPPTFWHAWTLMLEELSTHNTDGARTGTIRANIRRLESIDPTLGGEPWHTRIGRVRDKWKS